MADGDGGFFRELLARNPGLGQVRADLAQCLLAEGQIEAAIAEATTALAGDASLVLGWLVRASAQKLMGRFEAAIADFSAARRLAPGRASILINLAHCYAELDRLGEAEAVLREAVALDPGSAQGLASLGSVLVRLGRLEAAEAPCRAALALDPGLVGVHRNLAGILAGRDAAAARRHRDAAYRQQQIFIDHAPREAQRVLILESADAANVPLRHLLPRRSVTQIHWVIEYATPEQDRALPPFDLVFNAIGEAEFAPPLLPPVQRLLAAAGGRVLNPPAVIARTRRSELPALLAGIENLCVPEVLHHRGDGVAALARLRAGGGFFPLLLRPSGAHGGVRRIEEEAALAGVAAGEYDLTRFVDYRSPDGHWRKYRFIFVDRVPLPYHLAIGSHWLVHYWTAGMREAGWKRAEEEAFLRAPEAVIGARGMAALRAIGARMDLDYGGIDFTVLPDGRVLVFEANATMLVHPEPEAMFAYRNPSVQRIQENFEGLLRRRMRG